MNVTTVNGSAGSFLTLWPPTARPLASNLNWRANDGAMPNKVDVKLGADGRIKIFNNAGSLDVIARHRRLLRRPQPRRPVLHEGRGRCSSTGSGHASEPHGAPRHVQPVVFDHPQRRSPPPASRTALRPAAGSTLVPLIVPVGAKLISIEVDVIDGATATLYALQFVKYTVNPTGSTLTANRLRRRTRGRHGERRRSAPHDGPDDPRSDRSRRELVPGSEHDVGNAFCGATLNYETSTERAAPDLCDPLSYGTLVPDQLTRWRPCMQAAGVDTSAMAATTGSTLPLCARSNWAGPCSAATQHPVQAVSQATRAATGVTAGTRTAPRTQRLAFR